MRCAGGNDEEEKPVEKTVAEQADEKPAPPPVSDDDDDDEDWAVDTSEAAVAARLKAQEEAYNKVEKANGDREGEEELDEFELEKRAIGTEVKQAIQADDTAEAVKALMAVAKEHKLQCAAPRRRPAAAPPRRRAGQPPLCPLCAPPLHALHALHRAPCTTLPLHAPSARSLCTLCSLSGALDVTLLQV